MKESSITHLRLRNQGISSAPFAGAEDVLRSLVAMQAQEFTASKWAIGQRVRGLTEADVDRALADGRILRTHLLRPTWHYVLPADIRWIQELTASRVRSVLASYDRKLGLDEAVLARGRDVIERALAHGSHLTRAELGEALHAESLPMSGQTLAHLVMHLELDAAICSGAPRGRQHTYALVAERAPKARQLDRDEALAELALRYFTSRGPATVKDFRWWSSLTAPDAARAIELTGNALEQRRIGELTCWLAPDSAGPTRARHAAHLLQAYDEYMVAYTESRYVIDRADEAGRHMGIATPFPHAVIVDGQVVGYWRPQTRSKGVTVEVQWLPSFDESRLGDVEAAVNRYGRYAGRPVTLAGTV